MKVWHNSLILKNQVFILYSNQTLLNHSTGNDTLMISDAVIERLKGELPETTEGFASLMNNLAKTDDVRGLDFKEDKIFIPRVTFPMLIGTTLSRLARAKAPALDTLLHCVLRKLMPREGGIESLGSICWRPRAPFV